MAEEKYSTRREFQSLAVRGKKHKHSLNIQEWWQKNHAIYQNNGKTFLKNNEVEPFDPVQINIYQINTYRKDLSWLYFGNESRAYSLYQ